MIRILIYVSLLLCSINIFAVAPTQRLNEINNQIDSVRAKLSQDLLKRHTLENNLAKTEIDAGKLQQELSKTKQDLRYQKNVFSQLQEHEQNEMAQLQNEQAILSQQLRSAYILSRMAYLKLLLNQQDPSALNRMLVYDQYLTNHRLQTIANIKITLASIKENQEQISNQAKILTNLETMQRSKQKMIEVTKETRRQLLQSMSQSIQTKNEKLAQLYSDKRRLEQMIQQLQAVTKIQKYTGNFASLRGHLRWPTQGKILNNFGTQIEQSELTWNGTVIQAPLGQAVNAIADGKVIFAKWFSGYGLLLIVYHGNGFMTLYGRNQYLFKHEGDTVHQGEKIASVGESGGFTTPALYFAIRQDGKPLNPAAWCSLEK